MHSMSGAPVTRVPNRSLLILMHNYCVAKLGFCSYKRKTKREQLSVWNENCPIKSCGTRASDHARALRFVLNMGVRNRVENR